VNWYKYKFGKVFNGQKLLYASACRLPFPAKRKPPPPQIKLKLKHRRKLWLVEYGTDIYTFDYISN